MSTLKVGHLYKCVNNFSYYALLLPKAYENPEKYFDFYNDSIQLDSLGKKYFIVVSEPKEYYSIDNQETFIIYKIIIENKIYAIATEPHNIYHNKDFKKIS